jgi:hypothetical protein
MFITPAGMTIASRTEASRELGPPSKPRVALIAHDQSSPCPGGGRPIDGKVLVCDSRAVWPDNNGDRMIQMVIVCPCAPVTRLGAVAYVARQRRWSA